ncbi:MAG: MarP family serine protease [Actinomycetes bacterium]
MNVVDLFLVVAILLFAFIGWRRGFVYGLLSLAGFLVGAGLGLWLTPRLVGTWDPGLGRAVAAIVMVFLFATLGQVAVGFFGRRIKEAVTWRPAVVLDSSFGAVLSVVSMLLVVWLVATVAVHSGRSDLTREVRSSYVLGVVDTVLPDAANRATGQIQALVDGSGFPDVFSGLGPEPVKPIAKPDAAIVHSQKVVMATANTVKVSGIAQGCGRGLEGSGFAFAPGRVLTNAHVVAAVDKPMVSMPGNGPAFPATVVYFDPELDVAVLDVPGLKAQPLPFGLDVNRGEGVAVVGYPENGPLDAQAGRVRNVLMAQGHDIYGHGTVVREVISMRALVRPGNSGGPVLNSHGHVVGVVFAASLDDASTGYAMTADQVSKAVAAGVAAQGAVDTGACA